MNTGILEVYDFKLSVGYVEFARLEVEYELEGLYEKVGGYGEFYDEVLTGQSFASLMLDSSITSVELGIDGEEEVFELTEGLREEINKYLCDLEVEPEDLK